MLGAEHRTRAAPGLLAGLALLAATLPLTAPWLYAAPAGAGDDPPVAPDGRPGLGTAGNARKYAELLRSPSAEELEMLTAVRALEGDVRLRLSELARAYEERGYDRLLDAGEPHDAVFLHARLLELERDPLPVLAAGGPRGEAFARMFLDLRLRLRLEALAGFAAESRDVRAGLALFQAMNDGYVILADPEARAVARRVDLSAALLRALRMDLDALSEQTEGQAPGAPDPAWVTELIGLTHLDQPAEQRAGLERLREKMSQRAERLRASLFLPRLRERLGAELATRAAASAEARARALELRPYLPETEEGREPPREIERLRKHRRYAIALQLAAEGAELDLLDEELAYFTALCVDYRFNAIESRKWFDRFLAMRGIRAHEDRTYRDKELSEYEVHALEVVQRSVTFGR